MDPLEQVERLLEVGRTREAREILGRELAADPGDPDACTLAARIAILEDDLGEARRQVGVALAGDPAHVRARFQLFRIDEQEGHAAEAERTILSLIQDEPERGFFYAAYGRLLIQTGHLEKAREVVDEALRLGPEDRGAQLTDVLLATIEGETARAETQLADLLCKDPEGEGAVLMLLSSLLEQRRFRAALPIAQQLLRLAPDDPDRLETVVQLRTTTHWLGWPLWPLRRFGWLAAGLIWLGYIVATRVFRESLGAWLLPFVGVYLALVVYSWVYPPAMRAWIRRHEV